MGIDASGDLSSFPKIGKAPAVAELLFLRREKDQSGQQSKTRLLKESAKYSEDGKTIEFQLRTDIDVQKPELLLEQEGVSELVRLTLAKATLESNDGQIMAVYASALQQNYDGPDGDALRTSIDSFVATNNGQK